MASNLTPLEIEIILNSPALAPPPGQETNFEHPISISIYAVLAAGISIFLTSLAIMVRFYTKHFIIKKFEWEDYSVLFGWAMFVGYCIPNIIAARYGGSHQWDTRIRDLFSQLYYVNVVDIMYGPTVFPIKLSILLQYLRVFTPLRINKPMYICIHVVLWMNLLCYFINTICQLVACTPRAYFWNKLLVGHCLPLNSGLIYLSAFNIISDVAMLILPMASIWKLQLKKKKKLAISAAFGTGLLACVCSTARLVYSVKIVTTGDKTWYFEAVSAWALGELSMGILCSCFPVFPKFASNIGPQLSNLSYFSLFRRPRQTGSTAQSASLSGGNLATQIQKTRSKSRIGGIDTYGPHTRLNDSNYDLEQWGRAPQVELHEAKITNPSLRTSDNDSVEGQIVQTLSFGIEYFPKRG